MIKLKWHRMIDDPTLPSYVSYATIGKVFDIDGSSVRRLVLKRL